MNDLFLELKTEMRLARNLNINLEAAEKKLNAMSVLRNQISQEQLEAAAMVDEMLD